MVQKTQKGQCNLAGGVTVATVLPFTADGAIDWTSYARLLDYCATPDGITARLLYCDVAHPPAASEGPSSIEPVSSISR